MLNTGHDLPLCRIIGSQLVGDHHTRRMALGFQELAHQTLCHLGIATTLHQRVENKAVLINSAPKPMFLSTDGDDTITEMPFVTEPADRTFPDITGKVPAEFLTAPWAIYGA
jgi:hypothetical protein